MRWALRYVALTTVLGMAVVAGIGWYWCKTRGAAKLPPYIVQTNGRLELARIDVAV